MSKVDYRSFVPAPGKARIAGASARSHAKARLQSPRARELFETWRELGEAPFTGITTDGTPVPDLFSLGAEQAPSAAMQEAAIRFIAELTPDQRALALFSVESDLWRQWQNTELHVEDHGLRLEDVSPRLREGVIAILRASLSPAGVEKSLAVMRLNRFLGDLIDAPGVLNEWSYIFCLFGTPSSEAPWGWQLFGHHLCLNCLVIGSQMVLTPCFLGAEVTRADHGRFAGTVVFEDEERKGLALMQSLSGDLRAEALVSPSMSGEDHPPGRWHFADHLHLGGAHQDNRIVPYEGLRANRMPVVQQTSLLDLVSAYLSPLPSGPLNARMSDVERHLSDTHFCWIGGTEEDSTFYYRIQSPVVFIEFDHHSGVFLTNEEPARFHVHTIVRTPNGNDYGIDLLRLHYAQSHRPAGS